MSCAYTRTRRFARRIRMLTRVRIYAPRFARGTFRWRNRRRRATYAQSKSIFVSDQRRRRTGGYGVCREKKEYAQFANVESPGRVRTRGMRPFLFETGCLEDAFVARFALAALMFSICGWPTPIVRISRNRDRRPRSSELCRFRKIEKTHNYALTLETKLWRCGD